MTRYLTRYQIQGIDSNGQWTTETVTHDDANVTFDNEKDAQTALTGLLETMRNDPYIESVNESEFRIVELER